MRFLLLQILAVPENHVPDFLCLCGRIYKDKFTESGHKDKEYLKRAVHWCVCVCVRVCVCVCVCSQVIHVCIIFHSI